MLTEEVDSGKLANLRAAVENTEHALERARIAANEAQFNLAAYNRTAALVWQTTKKPLAEAANGKPEPIA